MKRRIVLNPPGNPPCIPRGECTGRPRLRRAPDHAADGTIAGFPPRVCPEVIPSSAPAANATEPPLVSVLVRSVDRPMLAEALASVAAQTHARIEVVVVAARPGHGPVPSTVGPHPARLLQAAETRMRSRAANEALDAAAGDWLLFLDDDDWLMPEHIARLVAAVQAHPLALAAYAGVALVDAEGRPLGQAFDLPFDAVRLLSGNLTPIHAVLFSRRLLALGCRFDDALDRYEDWDFWLQVAQHTVPVHVPGVSAVYRIHASSGVHDDAGAQSASSQRIQSKWLKRASPAQLGAVMQRVWSHDEVVLRLAAAESAVRHREEALSAALNTAAAAAAHHSALQELRAEQLARDAELQSLRSEVNALRADMQGVTAEVQAQAGAATQRHAELMTHATALAEQLAQAHARQADMQRALDEEAHRSAALQLDNEALRHSFSWRVTQPVRSLASLLRRRAD
jgi:hypothetical protein